LETIFSSIGARVYGAGSPNIDIKAAQSYHDAEHTVIGDRIAAATYLCAAAASGGTLSIKGVNNKHFTTVLSKLKQSGCEIGISGAGVYISIKHRLNSMSPVRTMPYPGFPTDAQPPAMAAAALAQGTTVSLKTFLTTGTDMWMNLLKWVPI
jgi:UDP-N-acetylglucosamine 1-carboxyvinyltransferase